MSESSRPTPEELARQARQHLASLKAAGVDWLPAALARAAEPVAPPASPSRPATPPPVESPGPTVSLFADWPLAEPASAKESTPAALSPEQRRQELELVAEEVAGCRRCAGLAATRKHTVFGVGPLSPDLCFVGEAPGADEDATGEPFVGPAGQLLNRIIVACGLKREEVYICNILRCLHGLTKVLTEDGWQPIQRIVARRYPGQVAAIDATGRLSWAKITGYHRSPRNGRNLVRLCLHSSRQGRRPAGGVFTDDHEVLTRQGYKCIRDLDPLADRVHSGTSQPSLEIRQALVGMILGDARFSRNTNAFSVAHGMRQSGYLYHKAKLLGIPDSAVRLVTRYSKSQKKTYRCLTMRCKASPFFRLFGKVFYPQGRKSITPEGLQEFGKIALAYLFMDDGYLRFRPGRAPLAEIATCSFTKEEGDLLLAKIEELGVCGYTRPNRRYHRIYFDAANSALLSKLIAPYVVASMSYKLMPEHREIKKVDLAYNAEPFFDSFTVLPALPVYTRSCKTVYCLSVQRLENFITLSGVVHNCRPPGNRTPLPEEAANCREYLERQLELVQPRYICALGATAAQNLLNTTLSIGRLRGRFQSYRGIPVLCTYHPSYLLRNPASKKDVWEDMKRLMERMGRPVTGRK